MRFHHLSHIPSQYLTCLRNYLAEYMHAYLVRLEVFIFAAFLTCASSEWPGETVYLPRLI